MIVNEFEYVKPATVKEALKLLVKHKNAKILAGGTDLICQLKQGGTPPSKLPNMLIDIKGLKELKKIELRGQMLSLGALVTFTDLIESPLINKKFPVIAETARAVASVGIRNRATMVGNICSAVPCMDSGPLLRAYEADIVVSGANGKKRIPSEKFFVAPRKTALKKTELVTAIEINLPVKKHFGCFVKLKRCSGEDLAQASVAVLLLPKNEYRVVFGSVAPVPVRSKKIEKILFGQGPILGLPAEAISLIEKEISPITDIRATKEYRLQMTKVMLERALKELAERSAGKLAREGGSII